MAQVEGPFELRFNEDEKSESVHFMQLDGEFMKVKNLKSLTFRLAPQLTGGSLRMLQRNQKKAKS